MIGALAPTAVMLVSPKAADLLGGDFASFYVAGEIVLDGDIDLLYEPEIQRSRQAPYHSQPGEFLFFAYPPFVAVAYASIAWLPFPVAFAVQSLASLAFLALAVSMMARALSLRTGALEAVAAGTALSLLVFPIATAVLGGQNTTFTLLLVLAAFAVAPAITNPVAGLAAGVLFYKPQFGLLAAVALALGRKWGTLAWAAIAAGGLYLVAVPGLGWTWPEYWMRAVTAFGAENQRVNGVLMVNVIGWWQAVAPNTIWALAHTLGWSPLFLIVIVVWAYQAGVMLRRSDPVSQSPGTLATPGAQNRE
jgi:hypothetical protein